MHALQQQESSMTNRPLNPILGLTPRQHARLLEQAKKEAHRLRREAIDAFASALVGAARSALGALRRAVSARRCAPMRWHKG
jgi:hypothetical protein